MFHRYPEAVRCQQETRHTHTHYTCTYTHVQTEPSFGVDLAAVDGVRAVVLLGIVLRRRVRPLGTTH